MPPIPITSWTSTEGTASLGGMRWAWLGSMQEREEVQRWFAAAPGVTLVPVPTSEWESLLVHGDFAGVLVTRGLDEPLRTEQLKKLVAAEIVILALHPAVDLLTAYELEVIRREAGGTLAAIAPDWHHPAWDRLAEIIAGEDASPLGKAEHISWERYVPHRGREAVWTQFHQDVALIRRLLGNVTNVNAVGDSREDGTWNSLSIHFASDTGRSAQWSLLPPGVAPETRVNVTTRRGNAQLFIPGVEGERGWELRDSSGAQVVFAPRMAAEHWREQLQSLADRGVLFPSWSESCLDLEIAEVAEKSLRRKRSIDLFTTNRSEEKTFKGFMAASGCVLLVAILLAFIGLAMWDGFQSPFREPAEVAPPGAARPDKVERWPFWMRLWPVYPLVAFLLLQLLLRVARRPGSWGASGTDDQPQASVDREH